MSLLQLLSLGQSFKPTRNEPHRYRMRSSVRLPNFGNGGNGPAFRSTSCQVPSLEPSDRVPADRPVAVIAEAEPALKPEPALMAEPALKAVPEANADPALKAERRGLRRFFGALPGSGRRGMGRALESERPLDRVQVLRNDLEDSDWEVVVSRKEEEPAQKRRARGEAWLGSGWSWARMVFRFWEGSRTRI